MPQTRKLNFSDRAMKCAAVSKLHMVVMVAMIFARLRPILAFSPGPTQRRGWVPSASIKLQTIRFSSTSSDEDGNVEIGDSDDSLAEYRNKNNIRDQVFSAISKDGGIKVTAATARNAVNELMVMHNMNAVSADALGRTSICALMMSNGMQKEQTLQITLNST